MVNFREYFSIYQNYVALAFFLSGFAALTCEIVWQRSLVRVTGATLTATACTLAIFMAWMAIGSAVGGRLLKERKDALKIYCVLELVLGVSAVASIFLLSSQCPLWYSLESADMVVRSEQVFLTVMAILMVPTMCMGATFPALARFAELYVEHPAAELSKLYAVNLAGAVAGTICSGFILLPLLGITNTVICSAVLNLVAAACAYAAMNKCQSMNVKQLPEQGKSGDGAGLFSIVYLMSVVLVTSTISMGLEVIWTRYFSLLIGASIYSVASVLAAVLVGLMIGAWLAKRLIESPMSTELLISLSLVGAFACLFVFLDFEWPILLMAEELCTWLKGNLSSFSAMLGSRMFIVAVAAMVPAMFLGIIFPLVIGRLKDKPVTADAGKLYAASVVGSVCGPLLAGFYAIPYFQEVSESGIHSSLQAAALALFALCLLSAVVVPRDKGSALKTLIAVALVMLAATYFISNLLLAPHVRMSEFARSGYAFVDPHLKRGSQVMSMYKTGEKIAFYKEGKNTTVTVGVRPDVNLIYLKNDGKTEASLPLDVTRPSPASDWPTQILLGAIPSLFAPKLDNVLLIGLGTGATLHSLVQTSATKHVDVAELESAVVDAAAFFTKATNNVLQDPRVSLKVADGRNVLAASSQKYDVIVSQPAEPWVAGATDLYSRDFWRLAKSRLSDKGVFCQWLQLYSIDSKNLGVLCRTFASVFPNVYIFQPDRAGEIILVGFANSEAPNLSIAKQRMSESVTRLELLKMNISTLEDFLSTCKADPAAVERLCKDLAVATAGSGIITDDNVSLEYELPYLIFDQGRLLESNLEAINKLNSKPFSNVEPAVPSQTLEANSWLRSDEVVDDAELKVMEARLSHEIARNPFSLKAKIAKAFVAGQMENYKAALQESSDVVNLSPSNFEGRVAFAKAFYALGDVDNALLQIRLASWAKPSSSFPFMFVAAHFAKRGKFDQALENYKKTPYYTFDMSARPQSQKDLPNYDMSAKQAESLAIILFDGLKKTDEAQKHRAAFKLCNNGIEPTAQAIDDALAKILTF